MNDVESRLDVAQHKKDVPAVGEPGPNSAAPCDSSPKSESQTSLATSSSTLTATGRERDRNELGRDKGNLVSCNDNPVEIDYRVVDD